MKYRLRICNVLNIIFIAINIKCTIPISFILTHINVHRLHNIKITKSLNVKLVVDIVDIIMFQ